MAKIVQNLSSAEQKVKFQIYQLLKPALAGLFVAGDLPLDSPPDRSLGDYSLAGFSLAKKMKKSPGQIVQELAAKIKPSGLIKKIQAAGPYLNFFVDASAFNALVLREIIKAKDKYGAAKIGQGQKVMVEYFGPNTNKSLTVGHLRNICLGYSVSQLLKFIGYKVIETTIYNDRGIALAKAILAYQKWGRGQTPKSTKMKPDHLVGSFYVRFGQEAKKNPELEKQAQKILQQWEQGKKEVIAISQKLIQWSLEGYDQTLKKLGVGDFAEKYYESEYYHGGQEIVLQGLQQGIFKKHPDGYVYVELEKFGLPDKILLRSDGTSLYLTQDLYLATLKNRYHPNQSIVVAAVEQNLHFKQLFKILELLGLENVSGYSHLSYGMIRLPGGRIKSREGLVAGTGADELLTQLETLAQSEIKTRNPKISVKELNQRAGKIALAALKFYILAVDPKKTMIFEPRKSVAFNGHTGPYLQYVYARINSIFAKTQFKVSARAKAALLQDPLEWDLIKRLAQFPAAISQAAQSHDPAQLADYLYQLAKAFSLFYEKLPVNQAEAKLQKARLWLLKDIQIVLGSGLKLLGIEVLEKM